MNHHDLEDVAADFGVDLRSDCERCHDQVAAGTYCPECGLYDPTSDQIAADRETA